MQVPGRLFQERAVAVANVADEMSRESGFGRAHRPDMKVVHFGHVREAGEILPDFGHLDTLRHSVEREIDGIAQQSPRAPDNDRRDHEAYDRIDPKPAGGDDEKTGDHDPE